MCKTTVYGWDQWRTANTRWCTDQLLMHETDDGIHTRWCTKQLLIDKTCEGLHIPEDVQKNYWWMRQNKDPYQMMYETTVDGWGQWRNTSTRWCTKQQLKDEGNDGFHTRWCTKELLMDGIDEGIYARWWTKQLLMDEPNEGPIPYGVENNCWWTI